MEEVAVIQTESVKVLLRTTQNVRLLKRRPIYWRIEGEGTLRRMMTIPFEHSLSLPRRARQSSTLDVLVWAYENALCKQMYATRHNVTLDSVEIPVIFLFLIGINVYGWRTSGVNHVLIFELDPRNHLSEQHLMEMAAIFGVLWTVSVLAFLYSQSLGIPTYANPLALVLFMIIFLFNPTQTLRHNARFWLLRVLVSKSGHGYL